MKAAPHREHFTPPAAFALSVEGESMHILSAHRESAVQGRHVPVCLFNPGWIALTVKPEG